MGARNALYKTDLLGKPFGKLTVSAYAGLNKHRQAEWVCQCDCGGIRTVLRSNLIKGITRACSPCAKFNQRQSLARAQEKVALHSTIKQTLAALSPDQRAAYDVILSRRENNLICPIEIDDEIRFEAIEAVLLMTESELRGDTENFHEARDYRCSYEAA